MTNRNKSDYSNDYPIMMYLYYWAIIVYYTLKKRYLEYRIEKLSTLVYWLEKINPCHREIKQKIDKSQRNLIKMRMDKGRIESNLNRYKYPKK